MFLLPFRMTVSVLLLLSTCVSLPIAAPFESGTTRPKNTISGSGCHRSWTSGYPVPAAQRARGTAVATAHTMTATSAHPTIFSLFSHRHVKTCPKPTSKTNEWSPSIDTLIAIILGLSQVLLAILPTIVAWQYLQQQHSQGPSLRSSLTPTVHIRHSHSLRRPLHSFTPETKNRCIR